MKEIKLSNTKNASRFLTKYPPDNIICTDWCSIFTNVGMGAMMIMGAKTIAEPYSDRRFPLFKVDRLCMLWDCASVFSTR